MEWKGLEEDDESAHVSHLLGMNAPGGDASGKSISPARAELAVSARAADLEESPVR